MPRPARSRGESLRRMSAAWRMESSCRDRRGVLVQQPRGARGRRGTQYRSSPNACFEPRKGAVHISELVETKKTNTEGGEVVSFAAHERYAGRHLDASLLELHPAADLGVIGEGHHHARCGEPLGGDRGESAPGQ